MKKKTNWKWIGIAVAMLVVGLWVGSEVIPTTETTTILGISPDIQTPCIKSTFRETIQCFANVNGVTVNTLIENAALDKNNPDSLALITSCISCNYGEICSDSNKCYIEVEEAYGLKVIVECNIPNAIPFGQLCSYKFSNVDDTCVECIIEYGEALW